MVAPDGTSMHKHYINDLKASGFTFENGIYTIKGTVTVGMKDGPVKDVPVTIKITNDSVIAIWIGPSGVDGHFGTSPIYGTAHAMRNR
jgi:hypothetical protein